VTPQRVAAGLLAGPLTDARFRKVKRHLPDEADVYRLLYVLEGMCDGDTQARIRAGLIRVGALSARVEARP
jgi:hypothetical protein